MTENKIAIRPMINTHEKQYLEIKVTIFGSSRTGKHDEKSYFEVKEMSNVNLTELSNIFYQQAKLYLKKKNKLGHKC